MPEREGGRSRGKEYGDRSGLVNGIPILGGQPLLFLRHVLYPTLWLITKGEETYLYLVIYCANIYRYLTLCIFVYHVPISYQI